VRLISSNLGNTNEAATYFSFLIKFGFFTSLFSTVAVYIIDSINLLHLRIRRLIESNNFLLILFVITICLNYIFYVYGDKKILLFILFFYTFLFELTSALLIIKGHYFEQQKVKLLPYFFILLCLLTGTDLSFNLELVLVHSVGFSVLVIFYYFRSIDFGEGLEGIKVDKTSTKYNIIFFLILSVCVKYIPVMESTYLMGLSVLPLYIYSSKGYMVTISVIDQVFGLNLYHNSKEWIEKQFYYLFLLVLFSVLFFNLINNQITSLVFKLALINQFEVSTQLQLSQLSNALISIIPFIIFSVALKNNVVNNKGLKVINIVLLLEIIGAMSLYKLNVFDIGIFLPVIVNLFLWSTTSFIFLIFTPIKNNFIKIIGLIFILIYCLYVAKSIDLF